jgi:hypothetical protein
MKKLLLFLSFVLLFSASYFLIDKYNKVEKVFIEENKEVGNKINGTLPVMIFDIFQVYLK